MSIAVMNAILKLLIEACGFIAQLVRASHRYREVTRSKSWLFKASIRNCLNYVHNCDDHSLLDFKSAVQYMKHITSHYYYYYDYYYYHDKLIFIVTIIIITIIIIIIINVIIMSNSNSTEWSTIQGVIGRVISKLRARLLSELYDTKSNY